MKKFIPILLAVQLAGTAGVLGWIVLQKPAAEKVGHGPEAGHAAAEAGHEPVARAPTEAAHPAAAHAGATGGEGVHAPAAAAHGAEPAAGAPAHAEAPPVRSAEQVLEALAAGNRRFAAGDRRERAVVAERRALVAGQHPGAIVLSCSDSRVPPELIFDQSLGDLFVVRTAGNVADAVALGSLEYAAEHLHSTLLVVLGHEKCGAVTAAAGDGEVASPNLRAVVGAIAPAVKPLQGKVSGAELVHQGVEANVEASLAHVLQASPVLRELVEKKQLTVKRGVYDLEKGEVRFW